MLRGASFLLRAGLALLAVSACEDSLESGVELVERDSFAVLLSEPDGYLVEVLSDQRILAGRQHVLVSHRGPGGQKEPTDRLIELELSPGPQRLELGGDDEDEPIVLAFEAVCKDEIVGIELLQPNEEELSPGTWVEVDVVGVTQDGTQVRSIHPRFEAGEQTHVGYFAYRFDPDAPPQTLKIEALDWIERTQFHGLASDKAKPASALER